MHSQRMLSGLIITLSLMGCGAEEKQTLEGYVEGEYIYLSVPQAGYLNQLAVARGERVEPGKTLFSLDANPENYALQEAEAKHKSAQARVENLIEPRRVQEIAALEAQISAAETALKLSDSQLVRRKELAKKQFLSQDQLNEAQAVRDRDVAQLESLKQQLANAKISIGRKSEVTSAQAELDAAQAAVLQRKWSLESKALAAPSEGEIFDTYYKVGEWVPAGQPVLSLLPDNGRKLRFFVPEPQLAKLSLGQKINASCDGCKTVIAATIDYIASQAEYTPPVIYTQNSREKLVFRVEAVIPPEQTAFVHPGLPVDIDIATTQDKQI